MLGADQARTTRRATSCPTTSCTPGSSTPASRWHPRARRNHNETRCSSTPSARGTSAPRRAPRSRTCSSPATTCRPTSTSRRWRAPTSPAARRSRAARGVGLQGDAAAHVHALRAAGVRAGQARRRASCYRRRPAQRARRRDGRRAVDAIVVGARCAGLGRRDRAGPRRAARGGARPRRVPGRHDLDPPAVAGGVAELARLGALERVRALGAPPLPARWSGGAGRDRTRAASRRSTASTTRCAFGAPGWTPRWSPPPARRAPMSASARV